MPCFARNGNGLSCGKRAERAFSQFCSHFIDGRAAWGEADIKGVCDTEVLRVAEGADATGAGKPDTNDALLHGCSVIAHKSQVAPSASVRRMEIEDADAANPHLFKADTGVGEEGSEFGPDFITIGNGLGGAIRSLSKRKIPWFDPSDLDALSASGEEVVQSPCGEKIAVYVMGCGMVIADNEPALCRESPNFLHFSL